jgi:ABC-type transport system substrate-binding protein
MTENLLIHVYGSMVAEYTAYEACEIDFMDWPLLASQIATLNGTDPTMATYARAEFLDRGMREFDVNNMRFPTDDVEFRKALAHCFDKDDFIATALAGFAIKMDSPLSWSAGWYNPYCTDLYPFSTSTAESILDAAGYTDQDEDTWREGPGGEEIVLDFYIRQDDTDRTAMGTNYTVTLESIGIDVNELVVPKTTCFQKVMVEFDYHLYTGGWGFGRDPDTLYWLYHGDNAQAFSYTPNYPGYSNPAFDDACDGMITAEFVGNPEDEGGAKNFTFEMQKLLMDDVGVIPIYTYSSEGGYKTGWQKVCNAEGTGPWSWYTMLNTYHATDDTIDWGFANDVEEINVMHSEWVWDWQILDKIYEGLINVNPYDMADDQQWVAKSWSSGVWDYEGENCTYVEFKLREDIYWHDIAPKGDRQTPDGVPLLVDGAYDEKLMADDVVATINMVRHTEDAWNNDVVADVVYVEELDPYTVRVYMGLFMPLWALHWIGGLPLQPRHVWEPVFNEGNTREFDPYDQECLSGCGPWIFNYTGSTIHEYYLLKRNTRYFRYHPVDIFATVDPSKVVEPCTEITTQWFLHNMDDQIDPVPPSEYWIEIRKIYPNATEVLLWEGSNPTLPYCEDVLIFEYTEHIDRGFYTIVGTISPAPGPRADVDGYPVEIWGTIAEDINLDFFVNVKDAVLLGVAFASVPGDYNWNPACDINGDGFINVKDAVLLGVEFGWPI